MTVSVSVHSEVLGTHQWEMYTALALLARSGEVSVRFRRLRPGLTRAGFLLRIERADRSGTVLCGFELHDGADLDPWLAENADVIFKRSYDDRLAADVYAHQHARVVPMGLAMGCRARGTGLLAARGNARLVAASLNRRKAPPLRAVVGSLKSQLQLPVASFLPRALAAVPERVESYPRLRPLRRFDRVAYLVRAWDHRHLAEPSRSAFAEVTEGRARLIRHLRGELGDRFVGGFVPSHFVQECYADCSATVSTDRRSFMRATAEAGIAVSTVGLADSNPWKLAEYLGMGVAMVSEPLRHRIPEPLRDGRDFHEFHDVDECVRQCRALLDDPLRARAMGDSAAAYWDEFVRPDQLVCRRLADVVAG